MTHHTIKQKTIAEAITTVGIGLHSGREVTLSLLPAEENTGIVFQRTDLPNQPLIPAKATLVTDTMMSSNLVQGNIRVGTVEHLLSAVVAMEIDNLIIQVSAEEIPIMDGSATNFIELLQQGGVAEQTESKQFLKILKTVRIEDGDKWVELQPMNRFELNFEIKFDHPAISDTPQIANFVFSTQNYIEQIGKARTFGFCKDIEALRKNNLALGGSLDNAVVLDDKRIINEEGLRFADEFVRHKILDAIGDLNLIGYPLLAQYNAYKSGHALNNLLVRTVLNDSSNYEVVTIDDNNTPFV